MAETGVTGPVAGDERRHITLANYLYRPEDMQALSLRPTNLGAKVAVGPETWLLSLSVGNTLTIERLLHPAGESPCARTRQRGGSGRRR